MPAISVLTTDNNNGTPARSTIQERNGRDGRAYAKPSDNGHTTGGNVNGRSPPALMRGSQLLDTIQADIRAVGVIGEEDNAMLIYTGFTSRLLDEPLSIITRGDTSTGKSILL